MRRSSIALAALLTLLTVQLQSASVAAPPRAPQARPSEASPLNDPEEDCLEAEPEAAGISGVTDAGQNVKLEVALLVDGVSRARVEDVMTRATEAYAPLDIELVIVSYKRIRVPGGLPRPGGSIPGAGAQALFKQMKAEMGGARPDGSDVVHLLTSKDVYLDGDSSSYNLAGVADCIGGVRYPNRAFSFSEATGQYAEPLDLSGVIAAHEIGHLMGAHHHYGNCAEGWPLMQERPTPCTVMWPGSPYFNAGNFGTLEAAVVRGHAVDFASP